MTKNFCTCVVTVLVFSLSIHTTSSWNFHGSVTPASFEGNINSGGEKPKQHKNNDSDNFFCPDRCACSVKEKIIDCSSLGLSSVPSIPRQTSRLYLHSNRIESLSSSTFRNLSYLTYLILSGNDISSVQGSSFNGLTSLKYLILDGNNISSLPPQLFSSLRQLETISLARNALRVLPAGLFTNNKELTLLNLQGNHLEEIETGAFDGLAQLSTLNLDDNLLDAHVFTELSGHPRLNTLRLSSNRIEVLPRNGLVLPALKYMSLQSNLLTHLPSPLMVQCGALETLILNGNGIERVRENVFRGCSNLTKLELRENAINSLPVKALDGLTSLKSLYLHRNNLTSLSPGIFGQLQSVQAIFLCYNQLSWIPANVFVGLSSLSTLHLEWNALRGLSSASFVDLPSLESLYLHHNGLAELSPGTFVNIQKLKNLDLYSNQITTIKPGVLTALHSLRKVQVDPLPCSCDLLHLSTWCKRHRVHGITCREDGQVHSIWNLDKKCLMPSTTQKTDKATPTNKKAIPSTPLTEPPIRGPQRIQERKAMVHRLEDLPIMTVPRGPVPHKTSAEKVLLQLDEIQHSIVQLQFRMANVESILDRRTARHKRVCIFESTRLEVGDQWINGNHFCMCTEAGTVDCSLERT